MDGFVGVVHGQGHTRSLVVVYFQDLLWNRGVSRLVDQLQSPWAWDKGVSGLVLVGVGVSSNYYWFFPAWDQSWDSWDDNRFSEDCTTQDVSDGAVWRLPHFGEAKLLDTTFIGSDGGTLDADTVFLDGVGSIGGDFILGSITGLDGQVVVLQVDVQVGQDQLGLDPGPDDPGHFVTV